MVDLNESFEDDADETTYAQGRLADRTYASRSFPLKRTMSADDGTPARFVCKVFDPETESTVELEGEEWLISSTPAGRYQFKLLVAREAGNVKEIWVQRVPASGINGAVKNLLSLKQPEVGNLIEFLKTLDSIPVEGDTAVRVDDSLVRDLFADPAAMESLYRRDSRRFRQLITDDKAARDVVAVASRREAVAKFQRILDDAVFFDSLVVGEGKGSPERVWQLLFEANPWMLGATLSSQLMTSWSDEKLEQVVDGFDVTGPGKRTDALMRTAGRVRSMMFVEIKTHRTKLLASEYRSGCWPPSTDLAGGVAQLQGTVHRAVEEIGSRLASRDGDGSEIPGDVTYLVRPRSVLVVGELSELQGALGGDHPDKIRSFELYRRGLQEPDVVTFDELLARAEWVVEAAAEEAEFEDEAADW